MLRELLPNAVAHADFSQRGMTPRVLIFQSRIIIENPGGWPVGFALADFKAGISKIRNPTIARVLHDLRYLEGWGSGYERIMAACELDGYLEPTWQEQGSVLRVEGPPHPRTIESAVVLPTHPVHVAVSDFPESELSERQSWFLQQITTGARVSAKEIAVHFEVSPRTAERDIRQLRDAEIIVYVGSAKAGRYVPLKPGK